MKGYRFYRQCNVNQDMTGEQGRRQFIAQCRKDGVKPAQSTAKGNVIAVFLNERGDPIWQPRLSYTPGDVQYVADCYAAVLFSANSPVVCDRVSHDYLRDCCIRVSAEVARQIHPAMFDRIASDDALAEGE